MPVQTTADMIERTWRVRGQVQGVGFRPFVYRLATELGLSGTVCNDPSGVTIEAWGPPPRLDAFETLLPERCPALARIDDLERRHDAPTEQVSDQIAECRSQHSNG